MVNIQIEDVIGSAPDYQLVLSDHGHSSVQGIDDIQWVVTTTKVHHIEAIFWKNVSGSTDIFPPGYPRPRNGTKKVWYGRNRSAAECVYIYGIRWVHDEDGKTYDFDPIISIRPAIDSRQISVLGTVLGGLAILGLGAAILFSRKQRTK